MAEWTDQTARAYGVLGRQSHVPVHERLVREVLGDLAGMRAMDYGCGPGGLGACLVRLGATQLVALDESDRMIDLAKRNLADLGGSAEVTVQLADEAALPVRPAVDVALCSLVLMMSGDRQRLHRVMAGLIGSLKPEGRLLISVTHPAFRQEGYRDFRYIMPDDYRYWHSGAAYDVLLDPHDKDKRVIITDYHWTISDYAGAIAAGDGVIADIRELPAVYDERGEPLGPPAFLALLVRPRPRPRK